MMGSVLFGAAGLFVLYFLFVAYFVDYRSRRLVLRSPMSAHSVPAPAFS